MANIKPPLGDVTIERGGGSTSTCELIEDVIIDLFSVSTPLFEKRIRMMMISPIETNPPVAVVY